MINILNGLGLRLLALGHHTPFMVGGMGVVLVWFRREFNGLSNHGQEIMESLWDHGRKCKKAKSCGIFKNGVWEVMVILVL